MIMKVILVLCTPLQVKCYQIYTTSLVRDDSEFASSEVFAGVRSSKVFFKKLDPNWS